MSSSDLLSSSDKKRASPFWSCKQADSEAGKCRERERAVEQWMETASVSSRGVDQAEREAHRAREAASRLESEVKRLSNSLADLNGSYR